MAALRCDNESNIKLSRREFHMRAAALALSAPAVVSRARAGERAKVKPPAGKYVDVHTHLGQTWNTTQPLSAEELLRWMDAHEVAQAVVLPLVSPEASSYPVTTEFVLQQTRPYRDRLIPFCAIDPRTSFSGGRKGLVDMLRKYLDLGAKGFGEHKPGIKIDDPANIEIFAACSELKLPMVIHIDNQRNIDAPGLPGLAKALAAAPDAKIIGHGPGFWASISGGVQQADLGGYPRGPVAPGGALDALLDRYANLYCDLSAGSGAGALARDEKFASDFIIRRADRLLFGTDFLAPSQDVPQFDVLAKLDLTADVQEKVFRTNSRKLLSLATS